MYLKRYFKYVMSHWLSCSLVPPGRYIGNQRRVVKCKRKCFIYEYLKYLKKYIFWVNWCRWNCVGWNKRVSLTFSIFNTKPTSLTVCSYPPRGTSKTATSVCAVTHLIPAVWTAWQQTLGSEYTRWAPWWHKQSCGVTLYVLKIVILKSWTLKIL